MKTFMQKLLGGFSPKSRPAKLTPYQTDKSDFSNTEQSGIVVVDRDRLPTEHKFSDVYYGGPIPKGVSLLVPNEGDTIYYINGDVRLVTRVNYQTMEFDAVNISSCGNKIDKLAQSAPKKHAFDFSRDKAKFDKLVDSRFNSKRRTPKSKFAATGRAKLSRMAKEDTNHGFVQFPD